MIPPPSQVEVVKRAGIEPALVGQVVGRCVTQAGEQGFNVIRKAWIPPRPPVRRGGDHVDCRCCSSQQANHFMNGLIGVGAIDAASPAAARR